MEAILRTIFVYLFILVLLRASGGKRSLAQITTFDFILLMVISEVTQQALTGNDYSVTDAAIVILTLIGIDVAFTLLKQRFHQLDLWMDGTPLILVKDGQLLKERLKKTRLDEADILEAARQRLGLARLDQIRYAVLEKDGGLTVVPVEPSHNNKRRRAEDR